MGGIPSVDSSGLVWFKQDEHIQTRLVLAAMCIYIYITCSNLGIEYVRSNALTFLDRISKMVCQLSFCPKQS